MPAGATLQNYDLGQQRYGWSNFTATIVDRKPVIVRREDGFEKRWIRRCARCKTSVAYELRSEADGESVGEEGMPRVVYVLDGAVFSTETLIPA